MPSHNIQKTLPYTKKQLFNLVADIKEYPNYLPWCAGARIREDRGNVIIAELLIAFKAIRGKYTSHVSLNKKAGTITVKLLEGPFHHLDQAWCFEEKEGECHIRFDIDFSLRSHMLNKALGAVFTKACIYMMEAFEKRAKELYG